MSAPAAITAAVRKTDETFWEAIFNAGQQGEGRTDVRLVLAGPFSAGPARPASHACAADPPATRPGFQGSDRGILMLPYFEFGPRPEDSTVARSEDLLPQTRAALRYYEALKQRERVFDELFVVGWHPYFDLGYHEPGTGKQRNPALVPELIAGLAAFRFWQPAYEPSEQAVLVSAREDAHAIGWDDLPSPVEADETLPYQSSPAPALGGGLEHWWPIVAKQAGSFKPTTPIFLVSSLPARQSRHLGQALSQAVTALNLY